MFPTLIDVAGLSPDSINAVHDGISIIELFDYELPKREVPIGFRANGGLMWLDNDWKLVRNVDYDGKKFVTTDYELYNVIGDPTESNNLIEMYPEIAAKMIEQQRKWSLSVSKSAFGADYPEKQVLDSGRLNLIPRIENQREQRLKEWKEEIRLSEVTVLP